MDKKKYIDVLTEQANKHHRPQEMALSDFCDYLIEFFSVDSFKTGTTGQHFLNCTQKNPAFADLALLWLNDVKTAMEHGQWLDVFGILYEEMYLSRGKASKTGQFFTPQSVSDLMAQISGLGAGDHGRVNDCAAGSGRLLLAHYMEKSKLDHSAGRRFEYVAQDSDPIACKMCALNLMVHGMYGRVECRDTLRMSKPTVVYYINEVKYPFNTPYYSVRTVLAENQK
jgi:type I restriction enzyme M protein